MTPLQLVCVPTDPSTGKVSALIGEDFSPPLPSVLQGYIVHQQAEQVDCPHAQLECIDYSLQTRVFAELAATYWKPTLWHDAARPNTRQW